ncbi:MAG: HD domain-containing protein [Rhodoferax sp.]|nr:HD domain-containing protein [Rhodoferax sp.]
MNNASAPHVPIVDAALRMSEARYRRLFESAQDGILILNAKTAQIDDVNPFLIELLGYSHAEFLGKKLWEIGAFVDTFLNMDAFAELQARRYIRYDKLPLMTKDGQRIFVEFVSNVYDCEGIDVIQCNIRDNTKRHIAEMALKLTTRSLKLLSASNVALLEASSENGLHTEYCRIAVETGNYRMAWIGVTDSAPDRLVHPVAHYGHEEGYLDTVKISWADTENGNGPTGRAIRLGQVQFIDDIATDPNMSPWRTEALKRGFNSTIALPFHPSGDVKACLTLYSAERITWSAAERKLLEEIASDLAFGITAIRTGQAKLKYQEDLRISLEKTIQVVASAVDMRDSYTGGHQRRVANICVRIATELGLSKERIHGLHLAGTIHDLGKIVCPAEILAKPGRLSTNEFNLIKEHPQTGFNIIKDVDFPWPIAQIILQHHERIDGSGYPQGLAGDAILFEAKILMVADVVEAMASHRPYRPALGIDAALGEITTHRGTLFDADVVDKCLCIFHDQGYKIEN